ncbi:Short-chain dehydrogenase [Nymphaea thermarum]|nr:Short-chain dehydrogenase [Nymphaea thermarum]
MEWLRSWVCRKGPSGFGACSTAEQVTEGIDAFNITAIVTGATSGIGMETARVLALRGATVIIPARSKESGEQAKEKIVEKVADAKIEVMELDLSSLASVRSFAAAFLSSNKPLNLLINNAGIFGCPFQLSEDGIELQFATNHIGKHVNVGHFLLTNLLLDKMKATTRESGIEGRIVIVASQTHSRAYKFGVQFEDINNPSRYGRFEAYGQSKLANILHAKELARRLQASRLIDEGAKVTANSLHPGNIPTNIIRYYIKKLDQNFKCVKNFQGAATTCYLALHPNVKGVTGKYFSDCNEDQPTAFGSDTDLAKKLWEKGESGFGFRSTAEQVTDGIDASNITAIITGATSGIGMETARVLALRGATVIIAAISQELGEEAKEKIVEQVADAKIEVMELDLSSLASVRSFAAAFLSSNKPLNLLINNAGIFGCPFKLSEDGIELQFAINYIGHFLLTNLLLEKMKATAKESGIEGRIVIVASAGHNKTYKSGIRFEKINDPSGRSKSDRQLSAPGSHTDKHRPGAATTCYLALHPNMEGVSGKYFSDCNEDQPAAYGRDADLAKRLWEFSEEMTSTKLPQK